jgi:toxin ParE1/3/4
VKRLDLTEIARADLASIRRYSTRTWGRDRTTEYIAALRDTMKGLVRGTVVTRARDDFRPGVLMATSGRHSIFFEADDSRILVVRVLHDRMDYRVHLGSSGVPGEDA